MSNEVTADGSDDDHVEELPDGAGCTEIWEHLSERRKQNGSESVAAEEE